MGLEQGRALHPPGDEFGDVSRSVFPSGGIDLEEGRQRRAAPGEVEGKLQHLEQLPVPRDKPQLRVEDGKALVDVVQRRLEKVQTLALEIATFHAAILLQERVVSNEKRRALPPRRVETIATRFAHIGAMSLS